MSIEQRIKHLVNEIADKRRKRDQLKSRIDNIEESISDDENMLESLNLQIAEINKIEKLLEG